MLQSLLGVVMSWPTVVLGAIFGAVVGGAVAGVAEVILKIIGRDDYGPEIRKFTSGLAIVCTIMGVKLIPTIRAWVGPQIVVSDLKKNSAVLATIFLYHPEAEREFSDRMKSVLDQSGNEDAAFQGSLQMSSEFVERYFSKHFLTAPDEAVYKLLVNELLTLNELKENPEGCVRYFWGHPQKDDLRPDLVAKESEMKAEVIKGSVQNPSVPAHMGQDELGKILVAQYVEKNYDPQDLRNLDEKHLPSSETCRAAIEFTSAIISLGPKQASNVMKNSMALQSE